jgi:SAM-dependent methyltransferase
MKKILKSRFIVKDDPEIKKYSFKDREWSFYDLQWYSRIYEYRWAVDAINEYFADREPESVIDIGTGNWHPFSFMLTTETKVKKVFASDIYPLEEWQYKGIMPESMDYFQGSADDESMPEVDIVACISIFEHLSKDLQIRSLSNFVKKINAGGCLVMTFDIPGYDYETQKQEYLRILDEGGMTYELEEVDGDRVTSKDNPIAPEKHLTIDPPLNFFRLFAYKPVR